MADRERRLYGPAQLTNVAATLFTVPAGVRQILRYMRFALPAGADRTFTLSIGVDAPATQLFRAQLIPGGGAYEWSGFVPLEAGEIVQAYASANAAVTAIITGIEVS